MFNLSLKEDWLKSKKFCHKLSDDEEDDGHVADVAQEAHERLSAHISRQSSPNAHSNGVAAKAEAAF
jgi:hypothetical protein